MEIESAGTDSDKIVAAPPKRKRLITEMHSYAERGEDAYWTPPCATRALMALEDLPRYISDPCCGSGAILNVLRDGGHFVHGADVVDYWPSTVVRDYLAAPIAMSGIGIVTNPPFKLAEKFIRKAIADGCAYHAWLLRLQFLEALERLPIWRDIPPSRIWISARRIMLHRHGYTGKKSENSNVCYAWFVWDDSPMKMQLKHFDWKGLES